EIPSGPLDLRLAGFRFEAAISEDSILGSAFTSPTTLSFEVARARGEFAYPVEEAVLLPGGPDESLLIGGRDPEGRPIGRIQLLSRQARSVRVDETETVLPVHLFPRALHVSYRGVRLSPAAAVSAGLLTAREASTLSY